MYREIFLQKKMATYRLQVSKFMRRNNMAKSLHHEIDCLDFFIWSKHRVFTCRNVKKQNIERLSHLFFDKDQTYQCFNNGEIIKIEKTKPEHNFTNIYAFRNTTLDFPIRSIHNKNLSYTICRYKEGQYLKLLIKQWNARLFFSND